MGWTPPGQRGICLQIPTKQAGGWPMSAHAETDTAHSALWVGGCKWTTCPFIPNCHLIHQMDGKLIPICQFLADRI